MCYLGCTQPLFYLLLYMTKLLYVERSKIIQMLMLWNLLLLTNLYVPRQNLLTLLVLDV